MSGYLRGDSRIYMHGQLVVCMRMKSSEVFADLRLSEQKLMIHLGHITSSAHRDIDVCRLTVAGEEHASRRRSVARLG